MTLSTLFIWWGIFLLIGVQELLPNRMFQFFGAILLFIGCILITIEYLKKS